MCDNKYYPVKRLYCFLLVIIALVSCYNPGDQSDKRNDNTSLRPPYKVIAEQNDYFVKVNWLDSTDADYYTIHKNVNDTGWVKDSTIISNNEFNDYEHASNNTVMYRIQGTKAGRSSSLSDVSNVIMGTTGSPPPRPASLLAAWDGNQVYLSWPYAPGAQYYLLFRRYGEYNWQPLNNHSYIYNNWFYDTDPVYYQEVEYGVKSMAYDLYSDMTITTLYCPTCPTPIPTINPTPTPTPSYLAGDVLKVESFVKSNGILVSWAMDPDATEYAIYRDADATGDFTDEVYRGPAAEYMDEDVINNQFYYYKIELFNNSSSIGISNYTVGMSNHTARDTFEPNDLIEDATIVNPGMNSANVYCYKDALDNALVDTDWYYLSLGPKTVKAVTIEGFNNLTNNEDLFITIPPSEELIPVSDGDSYILRNDSDETSDINFRISVNAHEYINEFGAYRILVE